MTFTGICLRSCLAIFVLASAGCSSAKPEVSTDLSSGLEIAAALESAYAARPNADPKVVSQMTRLLSAAQAALVSWQNSASAGDRAAADAAIAALVAFEASATSPG